MSAHMKQDKPDNRNVLDSTAQGIIGKPLARPDGLLKVTGNATYSAEYDVENCLEGVLVTAPFAKGTVTSINEASVTDMPDKLYEIHNLQQWLGEGARGPLLSGSRGEAGI